MKRNWKRGLSAVFGVMLLAGGATALANRGEGHGFGMMGRHFVTAAIDNALEQANVTEQQRTQIYAARDKAIASVEAQRQDHGAYMEQALALFEADKVDMAKVTELRAQHEAQAQKVGDAITQALIESHDVLTPAQRKTIADYVRSHQHGHGDHANPASRTE